MNREHCQCYQSPSIHYVIVIAVAVIFLLFNIARILRIVPVAVSNGVEVASVAQGLLNARWPDELRLKFSQHPLCCMCMVE